MQYLAGHANSFTSDTYAEDRPSEFLSFATLFSAAALSDSAPVACRLLKSLASLFVTPLVCFQSLAASLCKNTGGGVSRAMSFTRSAHSNSGRVCLQELTNSTHRFASSAFSSTYELLFSQPPYFQKHLRCPLVFRFFSPLVYPELLGGATRHSPLPSAIVTDTP